MCTVTFIARRSGYALGMNRDEQRARVTASPPARYRSGNRDLLHPSEPAGGAWIGVNDLGATLALINWYSVAERVQGTAVSRGEIVRRTLPCDSPEAVQATLVSLPLERINPFRLIGVFPGRRAVIEWRWDRHRIDPVPHGWRSATWISSGFDEPGAQRTRGRVFETALQLASAGSAGWLRRVHRSHRPERGPYSTCMHREDAMTVSYTEIIMSRCRVAMRYTPGAPCCTPHLPVVCLPLVPCNGGEAPSLG